MECSWRAHGVHGKVWGSVKYSIMGVDGLGEDVVDGSGFEVRKTSIVAEAEADVTQW